ncbi:transcription factor ILR3-like isoform X2 [Tasmannia lanceolata]|uniref:transcription factor ILR3-like isoform X2 n=1 Tax=Tasmannia lanceolata TaxID=3420 RepID=UPI004063CF9C
MSDYDWINDVGGSDGEFRLILDCFNDLPNACVEIDDAFKDVHGFEQSCSRKRFIELGSVLELGRPPKSDKAMILSDAARVLVQLRSEARQLKEANEKLQETVKDLKVEKIELRDERTKLKADKQRLEHQVKAMSMPPAGFMPHITALHPAAATAISAHVQSSANKTAPFPGYPGLAMWQWMPPALVDTSQDHKLRPPVA